MRSPSLLEPSEDLATFFEVSLDLLCIRDLEGRFVRLSRSWEPVLGYTLEELAGRPLLQLVHPDDVAATREYMGKITVDKPIVGFINRYRHRDGQYRQLEWRARLSGDRVFAVARDVTDRMAAEAELKAAKEAAEAANRAKTDFLANISHEIRTPLNGVIRVAAALARTQLTAAQRNMIDLIETSGGVLERMVSDILDLSKIESGRFDLEIRPFDLRAELDGVLHVGELRAREKGLAFSVEAAPGAGRAFLGDGVRIKQVLSNLLSNAVKFTDHGSIRVRVDVQDAAGEGAPASLALEVEDTGVGFDAAAGALLFQRFVQADTTITRRYGGTGLGLSICKSIVEMMGGRITARSQPGQGSLFAVTIPLMRTRSPSGRDVAVEIADARSGEASDRGADRLASLHILLAEDHPINQQVVRLILEPLGARLTIVENGRDALAAFVDGAFDLVLMDMQMPEMDGLTATSAIRAHERAAAARRTPIIMLSANAMAHHAREALAAGADHHVAKPITAASLIDGVLAALEPLPPVSREVA